MSNIKHGGAKAIKQVESGEPFTGLAADCENEMQTLLDEGGPAGMVVRNARRLQVCSELYYQAFTKAAQDGDVPKMESMLKVWTWITNSAVRAWSEAARLAKGKGQKNIIEVLQGGDNGKN